MRKLLLLAGAVLAITFTSCGNKNKAQAPANDSDSTTTVVSTAADSINEVLSDKLSSSNKQDVTTTLESLQAKYQELVKEGKTAEAATYASQVQAFINKHANEIKTVASGDATISSLVNGIKNLPTNAESAAKEAVSSVKSDAENAANTAVSNTKTAAENKVNSAVNDAKSKANTAVTNAQNKANKKVEEANKKANDAVNKAANKALKGIGL